MKSNSAFTIFYFLLTIIEIASELSGYTVGIYFSKPLLTISLICRVIFVTQKSKDHLDYKIVIALIFALGGDVFLMIRSTDLFIPGLASFLIMQWLYIVVFRVQVRIKLFSAFALARLLPFLFYAVALFLAILPGLADPIIKFAVGIYAVSIAAMAWTAFLRRNAVTLPSFRFVFSGAILFMISDSLIAIGRFITHFPFEPVWVMGTYAAAQFLIITGLLQKRQAGSHQPV